MTNTRILFSMSIIFLLFFLSLGGCIEYNYAGERRSPVTFLIISEDGTKLISVTEDHGIDAMIEGDTGMPDYQVWNISSGNIILKKSASYDVPVSFSPDGKYFVKGSWIHGPISLSTGEILEVSSGDKITDFSDTFIVWSEDGRFFFTAYIDELSRYHNLTMWDAKTFTKVTTVPINRSECHIAVSPDATKFVCRTGWGQNSLTAFNMVGGNGTYLWNKNIIKYQNSLPVSEIQWAKIDEIEGFYVIDHNLTLVIWNASNGELSSKTQIDNLSRFDGVLFSKNGENYLGFNRDNSSVKLFNVSSIGNTIQFDSRNSTVFAWSSEGNIIAMGNQSGIIEIRNASTGAVIHMLMTPLRRAFYPVPTPSIAYFFISIIAVVFLLNRSKILKHRR
jgi:WD40 repeat protein